MRQLMYVSSSADDAKVSLEPILERSRHNNALDGITGLLWSDGYRFMQVLEGDAEAVGETFDRIMADPRHRDIHLLWDHAISEREFGGWSMAHRRADDTADAFDERLRRSLGGVSARVREAFLDLVAESA